MLARDIENRNFLFILRRSNFYEFFDFLCVFIAYKIAYKIAYRRFFVFSAGEISSSVKIFAFHDIVSGSGLLGSVYHRDFEIFG